MAAPTSQRPTTPWIVPMGPRSPAERHRASTPLELFFDLVFVVAVAQAAGGLHHTLVEGRIGEAVLGYGLTFFALWWAWVNFTWFASAYDPGDVAYRLLVFVQMAGSLVMAAGIPRAFAARDLGVITLGYVIMRVALVAQWLRAARGDPGRRSCALRYALGVGVLQVGWIVRLLLPAGWALPAFFVLAAGELLVPVWAERAAPTTWHPGHIAERYGLFTIIVLGESVLAGSVAIQAAARSSESVAHLATSVVGGLVIVFSMWWLYFDEPAHRLGSLRAAFLWGYGHLPIFASAAAVGPGIAIATEHATGGVEIGARAAGAAVAVPVATYLLALWALHRGLGLGGTAGSAWTPAAVLVVLLTPWTREPVLGSGLGLASLIGYGSVHGLRARPLTA
jgi:low temperature requirement protein LtrA